MLKKTHQFWMKKELKLLSQLRARGASIKTISSLLKRPFWSVAKKLAESKIYKPGRARVINNQPEKVPNG